MKNTLLICLFLITMSLQGISQTLTISPNNASVCGEDNIAFTYVQTGLVAPITCLWDFGSGSSSTVCNPTHSYYFSGSYNVCLTLTDANNFQIQDCVTVTVFDPSSVSLQGSDVTCNGVNDGSIICFPDNTAGTYTYSWSNGEIGQQINNLAAGIYEVTVTDLVGCTAVATHIVSEPTQITANIMTTNPSGCGASDAEISAINTLGGTPPYTYVWNNAANPGSGGTSTEQVLDIIVGATTATGAGSLTFPAGIYSSIPAGVNINVSLTTTIKSFGSSWLNEILIGIDAPGTTADSLYYQPSMISSSGMESYTIDYGDFDPTGLWDFNIFDTSNDVGIDAEVDFVVTLSWTVLPTTAVITGLPAGTYEVTITDSNGCIAVESTTLTEPSTTTVSFTINNLPVATTCAGGADGFVDFTYTPTAGITVEIISAAANPLPVVNGSLPGGQYCLVATDANGCFAGQECFDVIQPFPPNVTGTSDEFICPGETATLTINETLSSYLWSTGETTPSITVAVGGIYSCTITDVDGCTATYDFPEVVEQTNCVWPGDANYDGVADNLDILALGVAYGNTGMVRTNPNINWEGQLAPFDWDSIYTSGINHKHADCDGSGLVDMDDTMAVVQNYGLAPHALRGSSAGGGYPMYVNFDASSANYQQSINMEVNLGDLNQSIPSGYGIAFSIQFNYPEVINPSTVNVDFSNSIFGNSNETITLYKDLLDQGRMDFAITRFDHTGVNNLMGEVLRLNFIIEDNIDGFSSTDYTLEANIVDVVCIKTWGGEVPLETNADQLLMLGTNANDDLPIVGEGVEAYPNPTDNIVNLNIEDGSAIQSVRVFNTIGELITNRQSENIISVNTSDWAEGIYFFEIIDENDKAYLIKVCKK